MITKKMISEQNPVTVPGAGNDWGLARRVYDGDNCRHSDLTGCNGFCSWGAFFGRGKQKKLSKRKRFRRSLLDTRRS